MKRNGIPWFSLMMGLLVSALAGGLCLGGCAWVTEPARPSAVPDAPLVYYAGVDGLIVYSQPQSSAPVLGHLRLHQEVSRLEVRHGFANVRSKGSGLVGWVDNAKLIWRLPSSLDAETIAVEAPPGTPPATPDGDNPDESPGSPPPGPGKGPSPSMFDPF